MEQIADFPGWEEYAIVARAPRLDVFGALYMLPFPDSASLREMPIAYGHISKLYRARAAMALLLLSQGQFEEAESVLRETISFGFRLVDESPNLMGPLYGIVSVNGAREILEDLGGLGLNLGSVYVRYPSA